MVATAKPVTTLTTPISPWVKPQGSQAIGIGNPQAQRTQNQITPVAQPFFQAFDYGLKNFVQPSILGIHTTKPSKVLAPVAHWFNPTPTQFFNKTRLVQQPLARKTEILLPQQDQISNLSLSATDYAVQEPNREEKKKQSTDTPPSQPLQFIEPNIQDSEELDKFQTRLSISNDDTEVLIQDSEPTDDDSIVNQNITTESPQFLQTTEEGALNSHLQASSFIYLVNDDGIHSVKHTTQSTEPRVNTQEFIFQILEIANQPDQSQDLSTPIGFHSGIYRQVSSPSIGTTSDPIIKVALYKIAGFVLEYKLSPQHARYAKVASALKSLGLEQKFKAYVSDHNDQQPISLARFIEFVQKEIITKQINGLNMNGIVSDKQNDALFDYSTVTRKDLENSTNSDGGGDQDPHQQQYPN